MSRAPSIRSVVFKAALTSFLILARTLLRIVFRRRNRRVYESFAIVRFGGLGDVICATALIPILRLSFPTSRISFITSPQWTPVLMHTLPDECIIGDSPWKVRSLCELLTLRSRLKRFEKAFDCMLFLHTSHQDLAASVLFLNSDRLGFNFNADVADFALSESLAVNTSDSPPTSPFPISSHMVRLLELVGCKLPGHVQPRVTISPEEKLWAKRLLGTTEKGVIAFLIGGTLEIKRWPISRFAELGLRLHRDGFKVVALGSSADICPEGEELLSTSKVDVLAGKLSLREHFALLSRCALTIGNDTGLNHAAAALSLPQVQLFGPTSHCYGYSTARSVILSSKLDCQPCDASSCTVSPGEQLPPCMASLSVECVHKEVLKLMSDASNVD